jgi:hypothetical protein
VTVDIVVFLFAHVAMSAATTKSQYSQGYYCCDSFGVMFDMICDVRDDKRFALLELPYLSSLASDDFSVTSTQHRRQGTKVAAIWVLTIIPTEKDAATEGKKGEVSNGRLDIKRCNMQFQPLKRAATALKKTGRTKIKPG